MNNNGASVEIPDFVLRHIGLLQLQVIVAQEEARRLQDEITVLREESERATIRTEGGDS